MDTLSKRTLAQRANEACKHTHTHTSMMLVVLGRMKSSVIERTLVIRDVRAILEPANNTTDRTDRPPGRPPHRAQRNVRRTLISTHVHTHRIRTRI